MTHSAERGRSRGQDDHPSRGPHVECKVDHGGRGVPRHCRRGCKWPCPDESQDPRILPPGGGTDV